MLLFLEKGLGMYAYACVLHAYAYSKYVYTYNWAAYAGPMYAHAYSSLETLIQHFLLMCLYLICLICLCSSLFSHVYVSVSLFVCFIILNMLN